MKIRARRTLDEIAEDVLGPEWKRVRLNYVVAAIDRHCATRSAADIVSAINKVKTGGRYIGMSLEDRLFVYFFISIMWRGLGRSLLTDPQYNALQRHLWSPNCVDQIEKFSVGIHYRGAFIWDIPAMAKRYKKAGVMPLPELPRHKKKIKRPVAIHKHR